MLVDPYLRTSAPHIFAAGDITGRLLLVPPAIQDGFVAATNAVRGPTMTTGDAVNPIGSFTDPEYAQVGLTEAQARAAHDVVVSTIHFDATTRTIIDGRTFGFCKLIVDRATARCLGCHVVGERAVEITQVAAIAIAAGMRVDELAHVPLSFPTYAGILGRVAASVTRQLNLQMSWQGHQAERTCIPEGTKKKGNSHERTNFSTHLQPGPHRSQIHARQTPREHLLDVELSVGNQARSRRDGQSLFHDDRSPHVLWPAYETPEWSAAQFLQGIAGTLELFHRSTLCFQQIVGEATGHPVAVFQRIDQAGYKLPIDERILADTDTLMVFGLDHLLSEQEAEPEEIAAIREWLKREGTCLLLAPHHDVGFTDDLKQRQMEYLHHGDELVPRQQRFGQYTRSLMKALDVPVLNTIRAASGASSKARRRSRRSRRSGTSTSWACSRTSRHSIFTRTCRTTR